MICPVVLETVVHSYRLWTISGLLFFLNKHFLQGKNGKCVFKKLNHGHGNTRHELFGVFACSINTINMEWDFQSHTWT